MANLFLDANERFELAQGARVFGRSGGSEQVALQAGVRDADLDANVERLDLAESSGDVNLTVTSDGLTLQKNGATLAVVASLNQSMELRFTDGNVAVEQTGATQFTVQGSDGSTQTVGTDTSASASVPLGSETSSTGGGDSGGGDSGGGSDTSLSGQILVDGSAATSVPTDASTLTVGDDASGSLAISDGKLRTFTSDGGDNVVVAAQSGSAGSLEVTGDDTALVTSGTDNAIRVGRNGDGDLTVGNEATVNTLELNVGRVGDGSATIRGSSTQVTVSSDNGRFSGDDSFQAGVVQVAEKAGSAGSLDIRQGGDLELRPGADQNSDTSGPGITIGRELGSNGDLTVDGRGSAITISQESQFQNRGPFLEVGQGLGQGDLTVANGGEVSISGPATSLLVSAGNPDNASETSDASSVEQSTLSIESGGQVALSAAQSAQVAMAPGEGGDAKVTVSGPDSVLSADVEQGISSIAVAHAGSADLTIENGGRMSGLYMGAGGQRVPNNGSYESYSTGGTGTITVDGGESELSLSGAGFYGRGATLTIGRSGTGSLDVQNGGTVAIQSQRGALPGLTVGNSGIADGTVTVDGSGSTISISGGQGSEGDGGYAGYIAIGNNGATGEITVQNGGTISNDETGATFVGKSAGESEGTLTVTGDGTSFSAGDELFIGASFDTQNQEILFGCGCTGTATVENGASLSAGQGEDDDDDDIYVGNNGSLQVASGATLTGDVRTESGGTFDMGNSPGLAVVQGNLDAGGATTFEVDGTAEGRFDRIEASGDVALGGDVTVEVGGGFTPTAGDAFTIVEAGGNTSLADGVDVSTNGLPDGLAVDLDAGDGTIVATIVDTSDPDAMT